MTLIKAFFIALSTYSRIPVPNFEWKEKDMKFTPVFFPIVGLIIGAAEFLVYSLFKKVNLPVFAMSIRICVVPIIITKGIHFNGYMHTLDALSFGGKNEKRLEILRDLHVGAYSVIKMFVLVGLFLGSVYLLLFYSFDNSLLTFSQDLFSGSMLLEDTAVITATPYTIEQLVMIWALGFTLSRLMTAISVVTFSFSDKTGIMYKFSGRDSKGSVNKPALICLIIEELAVITAMIVINSIAGSAVIAVTLLMFIYYSLVSHKKFGGFTGDLAGWFLCIAELGMTLTVALLAVIA